MATSDITRHPHAVTAADRRAAAGQNGMVLWLTGLSGSGKSTVAALIESRLIAAGQIAMLLDGDNLRHGLCAGLGFSPDDRAENLRRIAQAAALLAQTGCIVIVSAISPKQIHRDAARAIVGAAAPFHEIFVRASLTVCAARDPKGLYKRAMAGEIPGFTGVSAPYEAPEHPDLTIDTEQNTAGGCAAAVIEYITPFMRDIIPLLRRCCGLAVRAGAAIMDVYGGTIDVQYKDDRSPLTQADLLSNRLIVSELRAEYPDIAVLAEESADDRTRLGNPLCFIVDPLDGTKEFIKRNGEFTVNIALAVRGRAVLGVVYAPVLNRLYYAASGAGAFSLDISPGGGLPGDIFAQHRAIGVSNRRDGLIAVASRSHGGGEDELYAANRDKIASVTAVGSSLKGCIIAEGGADIYYRYGPTMEWDTAAMQAVAECAGGSVRQLDGSPLRYNREYTRNGGFYIVNDLANAL